MRFISKSHICQLARPKPVFCVFWSLQSFQSCFCSVSTASKLYRRPMPLTVLEPGALVYHIKRSDWSDGWYNLARSLDDKALQFINIMEKQFNLCQKMLPQQPWTDAMTQRNLPGSTCHLFGGSRWSRIRSASGKRTMWKSEIEIKHQYEKYDCIKTWQHEHIDSKVKFACDK